MTPYNDLGYLLYDNFNREGLENNKIIDYGDYGSVDVDIKEVVDKVYLSTPHILTKEVQLHVSKNQSA